MYCYIVTYIVVFRGGDLKRQLRQVIIVINLPRNKLLATNNWNLSPDVLANLENINNQHDRQLAYLFGPYLY